MTQELHNLGHVTRNLGRRLLQHNSNNLNRNENVLIHDGMPCPVVHNTALLEDDEEDEGAISVYEEGNGHREGPGFGRTPPPTLLAHLLVKRAQASSDGTQSAILTTSPPPSSTTQAPSSYTHEVEAPDITCRENQDSRLSHCRLETWQKYRRWTEPRLRLGLKLTRRFWMYVHMRHSPHRFTGIKYPELDQDSRRIIWRKFFELAGLTIGTESGEDKSDSSESEGSTSSTAIVRVQNECNGVSRADLEELSARSFNGRTIKNIVRTSQALAMSQNAKLTIEHVRTVVRASEKFLDEFAQA